MAMQPISEKLEIGEPLAIDQLLEYLPALKEVARPQLENWAKGAAVLRRFQSGDVVCEEGAFGSTAFYIVSGKVDIFIANKLAHVKTRPGFGGWMARMKSVLVSDTEEKRDRLDRKFIPIDASVDLNINKPLAQLDAGELFGEMTCRTFQPRSATVQAREDCVMVEMLRVILDMLMGTRQIEDEIKSRSKVKVATFKGTSFKTAMDKKYRERSLVTHLSSVPLFEGVSEAFLTQLKDKVELLSFFKNQVICKQGEAADAFYLIRQGMVKVGQNLPGGEMVRTYLGRGDYFGEIGLLKNVPRTATCSALDAVDVVKIDKATFDHMLQSFPEVKDILNKVAETRMKADEAKAIPTGLNLDEFLNQGLFEAQNLLLIDLDRCTRCDLCVKACADAHDGVSRLLRAGLRYDKYLVATACRTCRDPLCMTQCPVGSIRRKDNLEIIIEDWCIGCGKCSELCPYGNINMHPVEVMEEAKPQPKSAAPAPAPAAGPSNDPPKTEKKKTVLKATTCDLCTQLDMPSCVYACPHDAARRVDPIEYFTALSKEANIQINPYQWNARKTFETRTTHGQDTDLIGKP